MRYRDEDYRQPPAPPLMDLSAITRRSGKVSTNIWMYTGYDKSEWIRCGEIELTSRDSTHHKGLWSLKAYLGNATDFEHDSAQAFRFELIGVNIDMILYGGTILTGWIRPDDPDGFRVSPDPLYNPTTMKGAVKCSECKGKDAHRIVPEGHYIPPTNLDFYRLCAGRKVEIRTGVPIDKGDL